MSKYADATVFCPNMTLGVHHQRAIFKKKKKKKKKVKNITGCSPSQALPKVNQRAREGRREAKRGEGEYCLCDVAAADVQVC